MDEFSALSGIIHLGSWDFNVIDIKDINLYSEYIKKTKYPANLWTSNFPLLWAISRSERRKVIWKIVDDMLVTFGYLRSGILYMVCLPFGERGPEKVVNVLYKCLNYCRLFNSDDNSGAVLKVVNGQQLDFLEEYHGFRKHFKVIPLVGLEKHFSIQNLISLSGKQFETVRRKLNKFHRLCPNAVVREYRDEDYESVMRLGEYWENTAGRKYRYVFDGVYFPEIVKHNKELEHLILVVELNGKIIGMVSGGELPAGQSWWCLSKYIEDFDGLSEFLIIELARAINKSNPKIELMNAGEDLGPGGLRFFKERFRPVLDLRRYSIGLKSDHNIR